MMPQRITIWGNSGSGKSTLAELAGQCLGLPVFHLDLIAWEQGWRFRDESTFLEAQRRWLEHPRWIIEGVGCWSGLLQRFRHADLIVHLDTPLALCQKRAEARLAEDLVTKNRFMADGCRYADVVERQREVIRYFDQEMRGAIQTLLAGEFAAKPQLRLEGTLPPELLCQQLPSK
jgi:adenylate kinase family enzyme